MINSIAVGMKIYKHNKAVWVKAAKASAVDSFVQWTTGSTAI